MTREIQFPTLYQTAPHPCPYIGENTAVNLILDPHYSVDRGLYGRLLQHGFRRNGGLYYRPFCNECSACISVRVPVAEFVPDRSQRRTLRRNADLTSTLTDARFSDEHFGLYLRYQAVRHTGDSMDDPDPEKYRRFRWIPRSTRRFSRSAAARGCSPCPSSTASMMRCPPYTPF
ncbi:MAG: hypothetical protein M5U09_15915 [Gammaproteobacteria bacterium]|nr:hypothetical protein [Gammaproteobacteria bacterium]